MDGTSGVVAKTEGGGVWRRMEVPYRTCSTRRGVGLVKTSRKGRQAGDRGAWGWHWGLGMV